MKIKDIKSKEVREEAVRLALDPKIGLCRTINEANLCFIVSAFGWGFTPQGVNFWWHLSSGKNPNTIDLKLPKIEQDEN